MIQINLLPDLKREYLRSQEMKHIFIVCAGLVSAVSLAVLVLLFAYVQVVQPQHRRNIQKDIDTGLTQMKNKQDAVRIVTVQGALQQLPALQDKKMINSRLFDYLKQFTPRDVAYTQVTVDLSANTITLSGGAPSYEKTNTLANNLKSAKFTYTKDGVTSTSQPFSAIVFQSLGKSSQSGTGAVVNFQLSMTIDPLLFNQAVSAPSLAVNASSDQLLSASSPLFTSTQSQSATSGANQ